MIEFAPIDLPPVDWFMYSTKGPFLILIFVTNENKNYQYCYIGEPYEWSQVNRVLLNLIYRVANL